MNSSTLLMFLLIASLVWVGTGFWSYWVSRAFLRWYSSHRGVRKSPPSTYTLFEGQLFLSLAPQILVWLALVPFLLGYVQVAVTLEGVVGLAGSIVVFFATLPQVYKKQAAPEDEPSRAKKGKT